VVVLGEVIVHGADALEPLGQSLAVEPSDAAPVLDAYRKVGRLVFHGGPRSKVRLAATDSDWTAGTGPEVRGTTVDLVQLLANRKQVIPRLEGPGVSSL
jgi:chitodextrinase